MSDDLQPLADAAIKNYARLLWLSDQVGGGPCDIQSEPPYTSAWCVAHGGDRFPPSQMCPKLSLFELANAINEARAEAWDEGRESLFEDADYMDGWAERDNPYRSKS